MEIPPEKLSQALAAMYEAASAPQRWTEALAEAMRLFDAPKGAILDFSADASLDGLANLGHDPEMMRLYAEHYHAVDPALVTCLALPARSPMAVYEHFPAAVRARHEYFDFARRADIGDAIGLHVEAGGGRRSLLCFQRSYGAPAFDAGDKRRLEFLATHFGIAKRIEAKLTQARAAHALLSASLDGFASPAYVVDAAARIRHLNEPGRVLLSRDNRLRGTLGRLSFTEPRLQAAFEAAVRAAAVEKGRAQLVLLPAADQAVVAEISVTPLAADQGLAADGRPPLALVVILAAVPDQEMVGARMRELYRLTGAEARVVALLAQGKTVREIAAEKGVSEHTLRSQLHSIYAKTGAGRQADLVRLALSGLSSLGGAASLRGRGGKP